MSKGTPKKISRTFFLLLFAVATCLLAGIYFARCYFGGENVAEQLTPPADITSSESAEGAPLHQIPVADKTQTDVPTTSGGQTTRALEATVAEKGTGKSPVVPAKKNSYEMWMRKQLLCASVAKKGKTPEVRDAALEELKHEPLLAVVALTAESPNIREKAFLKITNQNLLAYYAAKVEKADAAKRAINKIKNPASLALVATQAADTTIAFYAYAKIDSKSIEHITFVAVRAKNDFVRDAAEKKLTAFRDANAKITR
jgi:hypothetical protein